MGLTTDQGPLDDAAFGAATPVVSKSSRQLTLTHAGRLPMAGKPSSRYATTI